MAELIFQQIGEIRASDSAQMLVQCRIGRCHPLKNNRENQYAVDLEQPQWLVFEQMVDSLCMVRIIDIIDYH